MHTTGNQTLANPITLIWERKHLHDRSRKEPDLEYTTDVVAGAFRWVVRANTVGA